MVEAPEPPLKVASRKDDPLAHRTPHHTRSATSGHLPRSTPRLRVSAVPDPFDAMFFIYNRPDGCVCAPWCDAVRGRQVMYGAYTGDEPEPLYVGITGNLHRRMREHRYTAPWWDDAHFIALLPADRRDLVAWAEAWMIERWRPPHNVSPGEPSAVARLVREGL